MRCTGAKSTVAWWQLMAWLWLALCALCVFAPNAEAVDHQVKSMFDQPPLSLGPAVLSASKPQFLAGLPEPRMAMQKIGAPSFENVAANGDI